MRSEIPVEFFAGYRLTGEQLTALQLNGNGHVGFCLTLACPSRCGHCMVSSVPLKDAARHSMSDLQVRRIAGELPLLRTAGVRRISITGGEPLSAPEHTAILSRAASGSGIGCTVVTSCYWATSLRIARETVDAIPGVTAWHLSTDRFHREFVPLGNIVNASTAARERGAEVLVRMTASMPLVEEDRSCFEELRAVLPLEIGIALQRISSSGRAGHLRKVRGASRGSAPLCMTTGMTVMHDGTAYPCCSSLIVQGLDHPFRYTDTAVEGIRTAYDQWRTDPLLQMIRLVGFFPVLSWVREEMPGHPVLAIESAHPCDVCEGLWRVPETASLARKRSENPGVIAKVNELYETVFNGDTARAL